MSFKLDFRSFSIYLYLHDCMYTCTISDEINMFKLNNFTASGTKIVNLLRRREFGQEIIEKIKSLVFGFSKEMCGLFLKHCTLTNKTVGTKWRALSKPSHRGQGPELLCPLWLLVGTPKTFWPWLAYRLRGVQPALVNVTWDFDIILTTTNICVQWWFVKPDLFVPGQYFRINDFSGLLNRPLVRTRKSVPALFVRTSEISGLSEPGLTNHHCIHFFLPLSRRLLLVLGLYTEVCYPRATRCRGDIVTLLWFRPCVCACVCPSCFYLVNTIET